jgi:hypothetical protein
MRRSPDPAVHRTLPRVDRGCELRDRPSDRTDSLRWLLQVSHTLPPAELGRAVGQAMAGLGAPATYLFLVDHDHVRMHRSARMPTS